MKVLALALYALLSEPAPEVLPCPVDEIELMFIDSPFEEMAQLPAEEEEALLELAEMYGSLGIYSHCSLEVFVTYDNLTVLEEDAHARAQILLDALDDTLITVEVLMGGGIYPSHGVLIHRSP